MGNNQLGRAIAAQARLLERSFVKAGTPDVIVVLLRKGNLIIVNEFGIRKRLMDFSAAAEGDSLANFASYVKDELKRGR